MHPDSADCRASKPEHVLWCTLKSTEQIWGTSKQRLLATQTSVLIRRGKTSFKDASDLPPVVFLHTEGTVCRLSREFCSTPDQHKFGGRRHCRPGDSTRDRMVGCFPHWAIQPLAKRHHTIQDWYRLVGQQSGADIPGRPDWQHHSGSQEDHDRCTLLEIPVSLVCNRSGLIWLTQGGGCWLSRTSFDLHSHGRDWMFLLCWTSCRKRRMCFQCWRRWRKRSEDQPWVPWMPLLRQYSPSDAPWARFANC